MAITVSCRCGKKLAVRDELAGRKGKCPACGSVLSIPGLPSPAPPSAGDPPPAAPKTPPAKPAAAPAKPAPVPAAAPEAKTKSRIVFPPPEKAGKGSAAGAAKPAKTCHNCGAPVKAQEIFCVKCGVSLETRETSKLVGKKEVSVGFNRGPVESPWKRRGILAAVLLAPVLLGLVWHSMSEASAGRKWREATEDGTRIPRPQDLEDFLTRDPRQQLEKAGARISNLITLMGSWRFRQRQVGYEDFYHSVAVPEGLSAYRPDLGWWARGRELSKIEDWWEENRSGVYWDPSKRKFGAKKRAGSKPR